MTEVANSVLVDGSTLAERLGSSDARAVIDILPVAVFVVDDQARLVYVNQRLIDMVGIPEAGLLGRSAFDFLDERDLEFAVGLLDAGPGFAGRVMGPVRIRYVDGQGHRHYTQLWAHEAPPQFGVQGFIITLAQESVRDVLATAVSAFAAGEPLDRTLSAIAAAGRAAPLDGIGSMLLADAASPTDQDRFRLLGAWPIDPELMNAYGTPWRRSIVQGVPQDVLDCGLDVDARIGAAMAMAGLPACWVRPVPGPNGETAAVFVVWRRTQDVPSPNQEVHLDETVRLATLALEQDHQRKELLAAVQRDALTGVGNRASLNDRIECERRHPSVLFVDLDHFKDVNDTFGHAVGDEVIAQVGRRIAQATRRADKVYRTGGDEFIVVCDQGSDGDDELLALANRIVERLVAPFDCREHRVRIGATVGIASGRPAGVEPRALADTIHAADRAMYVAKERGRSCVHHADVFV